ncbi:probable disease resistance RPP8-like protein 2 [Magnolia sinica]|uniref:probable disease resistance RPP8-like protein 2 n=1 Tax=Magnolia sinica TaxID=86752 RepID=UPI002657E6BD|nr:probable disease resistance RPP8-like protein 2 [Magnolia sinica]
MAVEVVVSLVLGKLSDLLIQEAVLLFEVRDQVEWVERELKRMRCFLKDADAKQSSDERVKNWVAEVRDVAYDAEDVIDTFNLKIQQNRKRRIVGCFKRRTSIHLLARHEIADEIKRIKNKIQEISSSTQTYGIENVGGGSSFRGESLQRQRQTSPLFGETEVVGFEEDIKTLVSQLIDGDSRRCVVSVVGMGGLGKTTLAIKVYNNKAVKKHFDCCAWVFVSQQYVERDLLLSIIKCFMTLTKEELKTADVLQLKEKLFNYLKHRRYLVVLDDIWKIEAWVSLVVAFPDMNNGSRVLLTTRNRDVASYADARSSPHMLQLLGDEEGWKLFCKKAFLEQGLHYQQNLEKLGKEILARCCGLPLAIVVIGGLLSRRAKDSNEWEKVLRRISSQFFNDESQITRILALSYEDLPFRLKPYFLYFGVFPEDHEIPAKKLIQLWVAEGFTEPTGDITAEETAEDCLEELIHRSLIQVAKRYSSGRVRSCHIHDILRQLSISKAKEDKFLDVHHGDTNPLSPSKARRLAIYHATSKYISLNHANPNLRSVLCIRSAQLGKKQEERIYRGFNLLTVLHLDLSNTSMQKLPNKIGTLFHLRYLGFKVPEFKTTSLPSSISNLCNLETLHVEKDLCIIKIPSSIWKMKQLRHVDVPNGIMISKGVRSKIVRRPSHDCLLNLQTLKDVEAGDWIEDCLGKLTNLKELAICEILWSKHGKGLSNAIPKLNSLQSLSLEWEDTIPVFMPFSDHLHMKKMCLRGTLEKLLESYEFSPNLTKLALEWSHLIEDPMATLEKLPNLRILRLDNHSYVGKEMVCSAQGFPLLESLHVVGLPELEEWRVEEGAMPRLLHLLILGCSNLKMLPEGLQYMTALEKLEVWDMPNEFKDRMWETGGEDWHKIRHLPFIEIKDGEMLGKTNSASLQRQESFAELACEARRPDNMLM